MNKIDKNEIVETFDEVTDRHFVVARLETLSRIRHNLELKISEIDGKIQRIENEFGIKIGL